MDDLCNSSPFFFRKFLNLFEEVRHMEHEFAHSLVRVRMLELHGKIKLLGSISVIIMYEIHLKYYARRFSDPSIQSDYSLLDRQKFEAELAVDPSRYDQLLGVALCHAYHGQCRDARHLLQKIASSRFREAKIAERLLASLVNEYLK